MTPHDKRMVACAVLLSWLLVGFTAARASAQPNQRALSSGVITKSTKVWGWQIDSGSTKVDLRGTDLLPQANGEAKVEVLTRGETISIQVTLKGLTLPSQLGVEFLTYVLWVVTPEGRTRNAGEILISTKGQARLHATTPEHAFSLIVTAEPYFAVRAPSEMVVLQSQRPTCEKGKGFHVIECELMKRGQYEKLGNLLATTPDLEHVPLEVHEARNAVEIAKSRGAERYAPETLSKAENRMKMTEHLLTRKFDRNSVISTARQAAQFAEDARALAAQRQEEERVAQEHGDAAATVEAQAAANERRKCRRPSEELTRMLNTWLI